MQTLTLKSAELELVFEPEQGGKCRSLRDRRTGREWLWRNPHLPEAPIGYGDSYIQKLDTGGWDEIFPSVSPCHLDGLGTVPDHGDLVRLPWTVDCASKTRIEMSVAGRCFPFKFKRVLSLQGAEILCEYSLTNLGDKPFPWLWCAHPLLPFAADLKLEVAGPLDVAYAMGAAQPLAGRTITYEELSKLRDPWAVKLFSREHSVSEVTVRHSDGAGLRLSWDRHVIPYLGLWLNYGAWSGGESAPYYNIGIEPTTLPIDDLSAVGNAPVLEPKQTMHWQLRVECLEA